MIFGLFDTTDSNVKRVFVRLRKYIQRERERERVQVGPTGIERERVTESEKEIERKRAVQKCATYETDKKLSSLAIGFGCNFRICR